MEMDLESISVLLVTANVGSVFEDPSRLLKSWIQEFLNKVSLLRPLFIGLHLQEVGGKTYEKSMEYVQEFIKMLCESKELENFTRIRIYLDEDYTSAEHFTALGNLYFVEKSVQSIKIWNFLTHDWELVDGKSIHTGNIEAVATKEKSKFPQHFFPECKWSRKGFLRTRWEIRGTVIDLINIHLFHDASNLAACEEFPSVYCKSRRRALVHTLERFHTDLKNGIAPYFLFGDFNFRCDTEGVVKKLTEDLTAHRIQSVKTDNTKVQYKDSDGSNVLIVGKKEFNHVNHQTKFKESWLQNYDCELDPLKEVLVEYPVTFPPSYPYEEEPSMPQNYMFTRCPAWCDRILMSPTAKLLIIDDNFSSCNYNIIGEDICMGDHKPVYLNVSLKLFQGILRNNFCEHAKINQQEILNSNVDAYVISHTNANCLYKNHNFYKILLECHKLNSILIHDNSQTISISNNNNNNINNIINNNNNNIDVDIGSKLNVNNVIKNNTKPVISINVTDTENLNVCMCSLYASSNDILSKTSIDNNNSNTKKNDCDKNNEMLLTMDGKICPQCRNIINNQSIGHRKTLISKRLTLGNNVIVNRVDAHYLSLNTYFDKLSQNQQQQDPYTPESIESHSPLPEIGVDLEDELNKSNNIENINSNNNINNNNNNNKNDLELDNLENNNKSSPGGGVSPRQLKSRLEYLRRTSENSDIIDDDKIDTKKIGCFER